MLALTRDDYARDTAAGRKAFKPGVVLEVTQDELAAEATRRFPRLVPYVEPTEDEAIDQELADLASCDATADALLRRLESQRHRDGFERPLVNLRVASDAVWGSREVDASAAMQRLTGGGLYVQT